MEPLTIYAAVVATAALGWQVWTWLHRSRVRCDVRVGLYGIPAPPDAYGDQPQLGVLVEVINHSERPVRIAQAAFRKQDGGDDEWLVATAMWAGSKLPLPIDAHDSGSVMYAREPLEEAGMDWSMPVVAAVWLSTGERFESDAKPLSDGT